MVGHQKLAILVAEDDPNDVALLLRAFKKVGITMPVHVCRDGAEAIEYLQGKGLFADRGKFPQPRILITDLKMPRCNGFELLTWVRDHPDCNVIPSVVLSASADDGDVKKAYQLGANCYFCKPVSVDRLVTLVQLLKTFWAEALLPEVTNDCR